MSKQKTTSRWLLVAISRRIRSAPQQQCRGHSLFCSVREFDLSNSEYCVALCEAVPSHLIIGSETIANSYEINNIDTQSKLLVRVWTFLSQSDKGFKLNYSTTSFR